MSTAVGPADSTSTTQTDIKKTTSLIGRRKKCPTLEDGPEKSSKNRKLALTDDVSAAKERQKKSGRGAVDIDNVVKYRRRPLKSKSNESGCKPIKTKSKFERSRESGRLLKTLPVRKVPRHGKDVGKILLDIFKPKVVVKRDECTPIAPSPPRLPKLITQRPEDVPNIDTGDHFYCPEYAQDIIMFSQEMEQKWLVQDKYLTHTDISEHMRAVLTDWLVQVQVHLSLMDSTLHLCVAIIDRFLNCRSIELERMQLLGVTSLFLAAKYYERFPPEISTLTRLTNDTYTYQQIIEMERFVLHVIEFDLNYPTPPFFLDRFLMIEDNTNDVKFMCQYLLDLILTSATVSTYPSSLRAATSLFVSRLMLNCPLEEKAWTLSLAYYTKYSENQLLGCAKSIANTTETIPKYQGAYVKFSSNSMFSAISKHKSLEPCLINESLDAVSQRHDIPIQIK